MRIEHFIIVAVLMAACSSSRPTRLSFAKGGVSSGSEDANDLGSENGLLANLVDSRATMRINNFEVLVNKLKVVTGLDESSDAIVMARKSSQSLGAYDYAQGVIPETKWTLDKMGTWFKVIDQACRDTKLVEKIQKTGGEVEFLESSYGRDIDDDEISMFNDLKLTGDRRARVLCTAILTSGEFISL